MLHLLKPGGDDKEILMFNLNHIGRFTALVIALAIASAYPAQADMVYNATGGAENGGDPLSAATGAGPVLADRFVNPFDGTLTSVELNLRLSPGASAGQGFTVDLFADAGAAGPGAPLVQIASVLDTSLTSGFSLMTFTPGTDFLLTGGHSYYIGVLDNGSNAVLGNTLDPAVLAHPDVAAGASYFNNGGVQANSGGPYEIRVNTSPVPEPSSFALLLTGIGALGTMRRRFTA
jgi:hypothetical protein